MPEDNSTQGNAAAGPEGQSEVSPISGGKAEEKTCKGGCYEKPYFSKKTKDFISLFTLLAVSFYTGITVLLWCNSNEQIVALRDQTTRANPPKLLVRNVDIWPADGKDGDAINLTPGLALKGLASVVNAGPEAATLGTGDSVSTCITFWNVGPLPMFRPYFSEGPRIKSCDSLQTKKLRSGEFGVWNFETTVPEDYSMAMDFYFMGFVAHFDRLGGRHLTLFARRYDVGKRRFQPVKNNPDYEGYE